MGSAHASPKAVMVLRGFLEFFHPHYVFNFMLSTVFYMLKTTPPLCSMLFDDCILALREWELLTFLGCIIVMKNRKQPSVKVYVGTICMFAKILTTILFFRQNVIYGIIYVIVCLLHLAFLPEPAYKGPDLVTYFRGDDFEVELARDKRVTWLVEFYAAWSPNCVNFAQIFAELSSKYTLDNLRFGKVDVTRFPDLAKQYYISTSSWTKQLPSVILFQAGKESRRRPACDQSGKVAQKFIFSRENVLNAFELNELHNQCKKNPIKKKNKADLNSSSA